MKNVKTQIYTFAETEDEPFILESGEPFGSLSVAYEMYGELNEKRDNAILLFHALSGSQHAAGYNDQVPEAGDLWREECYTGWWDGFIGAGKALDTDRFCVICANWIGGCYGSSGPRSIDPATGRPYGGTFPKVGSNDIVNSQIRLLDHLGIDVLHAVVGSSLGGMFALNLAVRHPNKVKTMVIIAAGLDVSILQRLHNFEQIRAIETDLNFQCGDYYDGDAPNDGLALARMISHKTFVSLSALQRRARRDVVQEVKCGCFYQMNHPVESYMVHQSHKFALRFDANSYLRILEVWQKYDLLKDAGAVDLVDLFKGCKNQRFLVFSIDSDVCFYPEDQAELVDVLHQAGVSCQHITVHSEKGHDAFLLQPELFIPHLDYTLREQW